MTTTTLSLRIPTDLAQELSLIADATGRSRTYVAVQAMRDFVDRESWQIAEIKKALLEAEAGDFATDEEVAAIKSKWSDNAG